MDRKSFILAPGTIAIDVRGLNYNYSSRNALQPALEGVTFQVHAGERVLCVGGNGAGKSTLLAILGGRKLIECNKCEVLGREAFHDCTLQRDVCYMGDWWRSKDFSMNISIRQLLSEYADAPRTLELAEVLGVDLNWLVNNISDGQLRRSQLLVGLAPEKKIYLLDEATTDLDVIGRDRLLDVLKKESDRGAVVIYCTHIFDNLDDWATHIMRVRRGRLVGKWPMTQCEEYVNYVQRQELCPLYKTVSGWIWQDWEDYLGSGKGKRQRMF